MRAHHGWCTSGLMCQAAVVPFEEVECVNKNLQLTSAMSNFRALGGELTIMHLLVVCIFQVEELRLLTSVKGEGARDFV